MRFAYCALRHFEFFDWYRYWYWYDSAARLESINSLSTISRQGVDWARYTYDALGRVTSFSGTSTTAPWSYTYDGGGNRRSVSIGANQYNFSYQDGPNPLSNRMTHAGWPTPPRSIVHDASGNLLADGRHTHVHDASGRRIRTTIGTDTYHYAYNGLGERVRKRGPAPIVPGGELLFVYGSDGQLIGEYDSAGVSVRRTHIEY